jgi:hypothetical protein
MNINKDDLKEFDGVKIRLITDNGFAYIGDIISYGEDYIKIKDKYGHTRFITFKSINILEKANELR